jgi:hypothetical protein
MSMLDRYRKAGGFNQLLLLLETSNTAKRQKFLELIEAEDSSWAETLRGKMLSLDRILKWDDPTLMEVIAGQHDITVAVFLHGQNDTIKERVLKLSGTRFRRIEEAYKEKVPNAAEISAMSAKVVETTRAMIVQKTLKMLKVDPQLDVPDDIEDMLLAKARESKSNSGISGGLSQTSGTASDSKPASHAMVPPAALNANSSKELGDMHKKVLELQKENAQIRHDLKVAHSKLDQIKKIA